MEKIIKKLVLQYGVSSILHNLILYLSKIHNEEDDSYISCLIENLKKALRQYEDDKNDDNWTVSNRGD